MKRINKNLDSQKNLVVKNLYRHKFLFIGLFSICIIYFFIKIFFTPALLNETHFSNAYFDRNGNLLRITLSADEKYRLFTPLDKISPYVKQATILYEDKYFYYHPGINPISLIKATINYFSGTNRPIGASTITMQVARLKYDLNTTKTPGKLKQIAAAFYIDLFYSKDEILEAYLNLAPYGSNIESIGAASLIYFEKTPDKLSKIESITLSTIPQNPIKRSLNTTSGISNIKEMRKDLVTRWLQKYPQDNNLILLADMPIKARTTKELPFLAPHFINQEIEKSTPTYWQDLGQKESFITTTIDLKLQQKLERRLKNEISQRNSIGVNNAAAILLNYKTMEIISYIGSVDYFNKNIYGENDGVRARRSPGSTLKPLIYAMAVDKGLIHSMTLLKDAKINFGVYAPENSDSEFYGPVLAKDALTHSRNIPAINLLKQIGTKNFYKILSESGVSKLKSPDHYGISIALGGAEVSMLELAEIYSTMANLGKHLKIKTKLNEPIVEEKPILTPEAFFMVLDMLSRQSIPTKKIPFTKSNQQQLIHYWKTGTSSSYRDAWTAGIFGDFVLIVWVGNFDGTPNNSFSGAKTAAPIYFSLSNEITNYYNAHGTGIKNNNFYNDDLNITEIEMCDKVGGLAGKYCPQKIKSYFIPGKSPIETNTIYRAIPIDIKTGLRACTKDKKTTRMEVFEFWDAEYLDMFKRAGIKRKTPPNFMPDCNLDEILNARSTPVIVSPISDTNIVITSNKNVEMVSFRALSDMDNVNIFWFLDNTIIGTTLSGETLLYKVPMGEHTLRITDEKGATTSIKFNVIK